MASKESIRAIFKMLDTNWPPKEPHTEETYELYWRCLGDISDGILEVATVHYTSTHTFWPRVDELRRAAFDIMCNKAGQLTAGEAWAVVDKRVRTGPIRFDGEQMLTKPPLSELIERTVASVGGWDWLSNSDNYVADRAKFRDNYTELVKRDRETRQMLPEVRQLAKALAMDRKPALEG